MSEPITRADLDMLVAAAIERVAKMTPAEREGMMEAQRQSWVRGEQGLRRSTESASPPRVPGASAQPGKEGVESGPGQPMDICDLLKVAEGWGDPAAPAAVLAREAAAKIIRLREQVVALEHGASNLANRNLADAEAAREEGRRAGIEAAAQAVDALLRAPHRTGQQYQGLHEAFDAIRALADKPTPDALLPGLQHIMAYMIREPWTADTIRTFIQCEIAARKGG